MESAPDKIFQEVPRGTLPAGHKVVAINGHETIVYLIEAGTPLPEVLESLNRIATHIVRHGLWIPQPEQHTPPRLRQAS